MWMSEVEMNVWIRGRCASLIAPQAASMSALWVRASPQIDRTLHGARDRLDGLEVAGRGDREPRLDHVDAKARELLGDLDLLVDVERDPGRLLAVAQRGVEDVDPLGLVYRGYCLTACVGAIHGTPSFSSPEPIDLCLAAIAPPSAIPPGGGGEEEARGCRAGASFGCAES